MLEALFTLQYLFLNGFLIHHFFLKNEESGWLEISICSLLLSISLNSLSIYVLARGIQWPITLNNVIILSLALASVIVLAGIYRQRLIAKKLSRPHPCKLPVHK